MWAMQITRCLFQIVFFGCYLFAPMSTHSIAIYHKIYHSELLYSRIRDYWLPKIESPRNRFDSDFLSIRTMIVFRPNQCRFQTGNISVDRADARMRSICACSTMIKTSPFIINSWQSIGCLLWKLNALCWFSSPFFLVTYRLNIQIFVHGQRKIYWSTLAYFWLVKVAGAACQTPKQWHGMAGGRNAIKKNLTASP